MKKGKALNSLNESMNILIKLYMLQKQEGVIVRSSIHKENIQNPVVFTFAIAE